VIATVRDWFHLYRRWRAAEGVEKENLGVALLERIRDQLAPTYPLGEIGKAWSSGGADGRTAERRFFLGELARSVRHVPGDTAEAGVYEGATSVVICEALGRRHHAFDSFEGLSEPVPQDGSYWRSGDLAVTERRAREALAPFNAHVYRGWIPDVFAQARIEKLCLVHVDVDLHEPTRDAVEFFYPLLEPGGVLVCDDYGFTTCPGARRALDEFFTDLPETIIEAPTGQGIVFKR
jgi:hypothetical protein